MGKPYNNMDITQQELKDLITYDPIKGVLYTKYGGVINQGKNITFNFKGKRYRLANICYVYMEGEIKEGYRVCFLDNNKNNLEFNNLYLD